MSEYIVCPHCHNPLSQGEFVKVVRCRDCAFFGKEYECWLGETEPDEFCSRAERRAE